MDSLDSVTRCEDERTADDFQYPQFPAGTRVAWRNREGEIVLCTVTGGVECELGYPLPLSMIALRHAGGEDVAFWDELTEVAPCAN